MQEKRTDFSKKLAALVMPIAFGQLMLALVSASDAFMLGLLSQDALSAVSLAGQIAFVENLFLTAMTLGFSSLAAQYWGKGDGETLEKIFAYALKITAAVCLGFFLAGLFLPGALMRLFTNEEALIARGAIYLRVVSPSFLLTGISQITLCLLKNTARALRAGLIASVCVGMNILLNAGLIFGLMGLPRLEIAGAAWATVLSKGVECAWAIGETFSKGSQRLRRKNLARPCRALSAAFWRVTLPVLGNEIVWGVGFTSYSVILGHLGSDAVAASSLAGILKNLIVCFCAGLGSGGGILVGNELGAGRLERAKETGRKLCRLAIVSGLISGGILFLIGPLFCRIGNLSAQAEQDLRGMLILCSLYMVGKSVNTTTIGGIFCAGGDSRFGLICDAVTMWGVTVPLGFLAAFVWKLPVLAVYALIHLDEIIKLPAVYLHYKKYRWVRDLTAPKEEETWIKE